MKILVTGGAGYVGSVGSAHLLRAGHHVVVLDALGAGAEGLLAFMGHARFRLVVGDVRDRDTVRRAVEAVDAVVHLAAIVGEPACVVAPDEARSINVDGTRMVLKAIE